MMLVLASCVRAMQNSCIRKQHAMPRHPRTVSSSLRPAKSLLEVVYNNSGSLRSSVSLPRPIQTTDLNPQFFRFKPLGST